MRKTIEEQLKILSDCGIRLRPDVTVEDLLDLFDRDSYEQEPFVRLLLSLGAELEVELEIDPPGYASDDIWHFDSECIEDRGDYARIADRMRVLSGGALLLEDIQDYVDVEAGKAWLAFKSNGKSYRWTAKVEDDWVDPSVMSRFAKLLTDRHMGKRFTYLDLGGQDCLIGCSTPGQFEKLKRETGLKFQWLT